MPKGDPPIILHPEVYEKWLKENPKIVPGGPITIFPNTESNNPDDIRFDKYHMNSDKLPAHYSKDLIIFGVYNKYVGFKIWVTIDKYDYLLMAHQIHHGPFISAEGKQFQDHPHFHELDLYSPPEKGKPKKRYQVPGSLYPNIDSAKLLNAFMEYYHIEDERDRDFILLSRRPMIRQKELGE